MSSSVRQGLQSRLEPSLESRFLRLKLAPPQTNFPGSIAPTLCFTNPAPTEPEPEPMPMPYNEETNPIISNDNKNNNSSDCKLIGNQNIDMGGWSFLQSLATAKDSTEHDKVYVQPLVKSSASTLSEKSLEMCTESLGSETGSEVNEKSDDIALLSPETMVFNPPKPRESVVTKKMSRICSFPPPLTSISGSSGVQVKSHREGGRLVIQAVTIPPCHSYFHAERSEGRLRLSLLKEAAPMFEEEEDQEEDEHDDVVYYEENGEGEEEDGSYRGGEDIEGNSGNDGSEIGTGKLPRPSSCKESGRGRKGLLHWEPFLVAT
ncbi:hypothetical protein PTKIN_Ptkin12aG0119700 [Pterospermum kingtungense]